MRSLRRLNAGWLWMARRSRKSGGSRSLLTEKGKLLIERYNSYTKLLSSYAEELYEEQFKGLFD